MPSSQVFEYKHCIVCMKDYTHVEILSRSAVSDISFLKVFAFFCPEDSIALFEKGNEVLRVQSQMKPTLEREYIINASTKVKFTVTDEDDDE